MDKITINGIDFLVIEREDGSRLTVEINPNNDEYAKMMAEPGEHD
jgi:hypothetical protein